MLKDLSNLHEVDIHENPLPQAEVTWTKGPKVNLKIPSLVVPSGTGFVGIPVCKPLAPVMFMSLWCQGPPVPQRLHHVAPKGSIFVGQKVA